ncbi:unnamed protein product [Aphanomyces euteiches]
MLGPLDGVTSWKHSLWLNVDKTGKCMYFEYKRSAKFKFDINECHFSTLSVVIMYSETTQTAPHASYAQPQAQHYYAPPPPQNSDKNSTLFNIWYALTSPLQPNTYKLTLFHLINLVFAVVAFTIVLTLGLLGIGLIPLFCLGIIVLQVLLYSVHSFAQCDAYLYNCVAPQEDQITVQFEVPRRGLYHISGYRISPDLSRFSKEGSMAIFYFIFVKFPLAMIFSSTVLTLLTTSIALIAFPFVDQRYVHINQGTWHNHDLKVVHHHVEEWTPSDFVLRGIALLYFTIFLMHIFARIHRYATKFFTCEFFATSGVVVNDQTLLLPRYSTAPVVAQPTTMYSSATLYENTTN